MKIVLFYGFLFINHFLPCSALMRGSIDIKFNRFLTSNMINEEKKMFSSDEVLDNFSKFTFKEIYDTNLEVSVLIYQNIKSNLKFNITDIVFLNEVLPYKALTEPLQPSKLFFYNLIQFCCKSDNFDNCFSKLELTEESIKSFLSIKFTKHKDFLSCLPCNTIEKCGLWANEMVWKMTKPTIEFKAAKPNEVTQYSVFDTIISKNASCTGLSILLVSFLRTIGIPSRVAGVLHWKKDSVLCPLGIKDPNCGNHNWVEIWFNEKWHFLDQDGSINKIDKAWFYPKDISNQIPLSKNFAVYSASYGSLKYLSKYSSYSKEISSKTGYFPIAWNKFNEQVNAWDVTHSYIKKVSNKTFRKING